MYICKYWHTSTFEINYYYYKVIRFTSIWFPDYFPWPESPSGSMTTYRDMNEHLAPGLARGRRNTCMTQRYWYKFDYSRHYSPNSHLHLNRQNRQYPLIHIRNAIRVTIHRRNAIGVTIHMRNAIRVTIHMRNAIGVTCHMRNAIRVTFHMRNAIRVTIHTRNAIRVTIHMRNAIRVTIHMRNAIRITIHMRNAIRVTTTRWKGLYIYVLYSYTTLIV